MLYYSLSILVLLLFTVPPPISLYAHNYFCQASYSAAAVYLCFLDFGFLLLKRIDIHTAPQWCPHLYQNWVSKQIRDVDLHVIEVRRCSSPIPTLNHAAPATSSHTTPALTQPGTFQDSLDGPYSILYSRMCNLSSLFICRYWACNIVYCPIEAYGHFASDEYTGVFCNFSQAFCILSNII